MISHSDRGLLARSSPLEEDLHDDVRLLLHHLSPTHASNLLRQDLIAWVTRVVQDECAAMHLSPSSLFVVGSVPLQTYLPDGDIDLSLFLAEDPPHEWWIRLRDRFLRREERSECPSHDHVVSDAYLIFAEVSLLKIFIDGIQVDLTVNQIGGLSTLCMLETIDREVGCDHLFKKSVLLVKAWSFYESRILGSHHGLLSTFAVTSMVLLVLNIYFEECKTPLGLFSKFLEYYSKFDWMKFGVSVCGPVSLSDRPHLQEETEQLRFSIEFFQDLRKKFVGRIRPCEYRYFPVKFLNVQDPLRPHNNIGRSVSFASLFRIQRAFQTGHASMLRILENPSQCGRELLLNVFANTIRRCAHYRLQQRTLEMVYQESDISVQRPRSLSPPSIHSSRRFTLGSSVELSFEHDFLLDTAGFGDEFACRIGGFHSTHSDQASNHSPKKSPSRKSLAADFPTVDTSPVLRGTSVSFLPPVSELSNHPSWWTESDEDRLCGSFDWMITNLESARNFLRHLPKTDLNSSFFSSPGSSPRGHAEKKTEGFDEVISISERDEIPNSPLSTNESWDLDDALLRRSQNSKKNAASSDGSIGADAPKEDLSYRSSKKTMILDFSAPTEETKGFSPSRSREVCGNPIPMRGMQPTSPAHLTPSSSCPFEELSRALNSGFDRNSLHLHESSLSGGRHSRSLPSSPTSSSHPSSNDDKRLKSPYQDSRDTGIVSPPLSLSASLSFRHSTSVSAQTSFPVSSASVLTADARGDHIHDDDEDLFGEFPYSPPDSECSYSSCHEEESTCALRSFTNDDADESFTASDRGIRSPRIGCGSVDNSKSAWRAPWAKLPSRSEETGDASSHSSSSPGLVPGKTWAHVARKPSSPGRDSNSNSAMDSSLLIRTLSSSPLTSTDPCIPPPVTMRDLFPSQGDPALPSSVSLSSGSAFPSFVSSIPVSAPPFFVSREQPAPSVHPSIRSNHTNQSYTGSNPVSPNMRQAGKIPMRHSFRRASDSQYETRKETNSSSRSSRGRGRNRNPLRSHSGSSSSQYSSQPSVKHIEVGSIDEFPSLENVRSSSRPKDPHAGSSRGYG